MTLLGEAPARFVPVGETDESAQLKPCNSLQRLGVGCSYTD